MNRTKLATIAVFALLVGLGVAVGRLIKEICPLLPPPTFTPLPARPCSPDPSSAAGLLAAGVPLLAMWLSDLVIGGYEPLVMVTVYASLVAPIVWQGWLRRRVSATRVAGAAVTSTLLFFATTNLAVWYVWYPHTPAGATRCYAAALPFLGYSLSGDLLFAGALFAVYALAMQSASEPKTAHRHRRGAWRLRSPSYSLACWSRYQCCQRRTCSSRATGKPSGVLEKSSPVSSARLASAAFCTSTGAASNSSSAGT